MVYNHYVQPKQKEDVKKPTGSELNDQRIEVFMDILAKEKTITYDDMQDIMALGDGAFERLVRKIKGKCSDIAKWKKETRTWTHTPMTPERVLAKQKENFEKESMNVELDKQKELVVTQELS